MPGRIQYAFVRVIDPNVTPPLHSTAPANVNPPMSRLPSELPKFVQINWCGDGVPEAKKGLFHTHSAAVAKYLRGAHVVINARNEVRSYQILIVIHILNIAHSQMSSLRSSCPKFPLRLVQNTLRTTRSHAMPSQSLLWVPITSPSEGSTLAR